MAPDSNRLMAVDTAFIVGASAAICVASHRLLFMTVLVPLLIVIRTAVVLAIRRAEGKRALPELALLGICTVLGGFNDWNSVCHHEIYRYTVPHFFAWSSIPIWMLLYWGMILRFFARFARWQALAPPDRPNDRLGFGKRIIHHAAARTVAELVLILLTRQMIYRYSLHPVLSWLPFAIALVAYLVFFFPTRHDLKLLAVFLIGGPLIEVLYIQVGRLHAYELGWIGGVPLWIVLWWLLIIPIWKNLSLRLQLALRV